MRSDTFGYNKPENPRATANLFSQLLFCYSLPLFHKGWKRDITEDDLTQPLQQHQSSKLGEKMAIAWSNELDRAKKRNKKPSFTRVIFRVFYLDVIFYGLLLFLMEMGVKLSQPLFVGLFIRYFSDANRKSTEPLHSPMWFNRVPHFWTPNQSPIQKDEAWFFGTGIFICSIIVVLMYHPYLMAVLHVGMKIRVGCCSLIYRKALRLRLTSLGGTTVGNSVNLMANDVTRFDVAPVFLHYLWLAPLEACAATYFIYNEVGISSFYGMCSLGFCVPIQVLLGFLSSRYRSAAALRTDERIRQMNEIIQAMQVIKMYTWERAFSKLIHEKRKKEMNVIIKTSFIKGLIMSFIMFIARLGIFLTVLCCVWLEGKITAENVFMIASYYMIVRQTMTVYFPQGVSMVAEASVSIRRIEEFMLIAEADVGDPTVLDPSFFDKGKAMPIVNFNIPLYQREQPEVSIYHGIAKYGPEVCLEDVDVDMHPRDLTGVVGPVGSGKSCLLQLILGELQLYSGTLVVKGTISFASQEPWLFAGSVRQNILFGREYKVNRYRQVVKVCALLRDFEILPYGDQTIIGERGISLSGGQRARVNLARAVYKEADIYLLDDPLSAVDIHVGGQLFEQCIVKYLGNKIVVLVTHQLQYLSSATRIMVMSEGAMALCSSYTSIITSTLDFANLIEEAIGLHSVVVSEPPDLKKEVVKEISRRSLLLTSTIDVEGIKNLPREQLEMRTVGAVDCSNYKNYFLSGGNCFLIFILFVFFLGAQVLGSGGDYFLGRWVELEELRSHHGTAESMGWWNNFSRKECVLIFTIIIILTVVVAVTRSLYFFTICMRASVRLHDKMFDSVINACMRFFNTNTSGRILNRFSKDLGSVDELLPYAFIDTTQLLLNLVGAIVVVGVINFWLLIPIAVMVVSFYFLRKFYITTSRSVKRLEGITKSPVLAHLNATLQGLPTIRSSGAEQILVSEFDALQDDHSSAWFMFLYTSRFFGLWADMVCAVFIGVVTLSFILFEDQFNGGTVGLAITQCIGLSGLIQWGLRQSAELENQMTSVERIFEFTRIEHEPELESTPEKRPPVTWPRLGRIEFVKVYMSYSADEPPVLKNLNLSIQSEEKIGIVGRTGAGKSSLIATLFRLSNYEGTIMIDNLNISILGLHDLRRKISIIPQEPVLFSGTMRYNLDPFGEFNDEQMVSALIDVENRHALQYGKDCLDDLVTEGGTNISVGQRQMICLARAILRNNKILVMDEATANVDAMTDKMIQTTIRKKFDHCTVLTIAHRLHTVMDSDRVIVMSAGVPVQFDHPHILLQDRNGTFYDMVAKTGTAMAKTLTRIAKESYEVRKAKMLTTAIKPKRPNESGSSK